MENPKENADNPTGTGIRLESWRSAWNQFTEQPILGGGIGHTFKGCLEKGIIAGEYHEAASRKTIPHNIFFDVLALRGLVGLVGLLTLWGTLAWVFVTAARSALPERRQPAIAGYALLLGYALFGLTYSMMQYGALVLFFCLYSALIVHLTTRSDDGNGSTPVDTNAEPPAKGQP